MFRTFETELAGRKLVIENGKIAELANGSVIVRYGETVVMVNVTASKEPKEGSVGYAKVYLGASEVYREIIYAQEIKNYHKGLLEWFKSLW